MKHLFPLAVMSGLALASCNPGPSSPEATPRDVESDRGKAAPPPPIQPSRGSADRVGAENPNLSPARLTPEAERGETGARNVLLSFARAIELKKFRQAYAMMRGKARAGTSAGQLADRFADFGRISVAAPSGTIEGAAGTTYYTAPVTITGSNGPELTGDIILSRVNDVPGANEDQLRWHVARLDLAPAD